MNSINTLSPEIVRLFQTIREHGIDTVPRIKMLMNWVKLDPADKTIINELKESTEREITLQQSSPDPFRKTAPRDFKQFSGELNLGIIPHHGYSFSATIQSINKHWLILGTTGGGKSTIVRNALFQILQQLRPPKIMILERKQEYTELLSLFPKMHVLDSKSLAFNPLKPPKGINTMQWIGIFTECMVNYLDIREASSSFIMDHALRLIQNMKSEGRYPTLGDLRAFITQQPYKPFSKNGQQKETVLNRLNGLINSLPAMFESDRETDLEKLINNHCIILLHDITHGTIQNFVISLLIAETFLYRKIHCGLQEQLKSIVVLDEASSLFRRSDEIKDHVSFINDVIKTARGYGTGFIAASQMATDLSHALLANAGTRMMVGGFGRTEDIDVFIRLRGCSKEQRQYVINHPIVGKAFIVDERWPHIIECNLHNSAFPLRPSTKELQNRIQKSVDELTNKVFPSPAPSTDTNSPKPIIAPKSDNTTPSNNQSASIEIRVLLHIYFNHFMRLKDRAKALDIPSASLRRTISNLESEGYIIGHKVHGKAGAPRDLYEVTPSGLKLISQPERKLKGKGGFLHKFYQQQVSNYFKSQGYKTDIEGVLNGKGIDVIARKQVDGECIAIEIELHANSNPDHVIENIEKAVSATSTTQVFCLVPTEAEKKLIQKSATGSLFMKKPIHVERLWKYLED